MDGMNGTEAHDAPQPDVVAEMVAAALATRPTALRTSPYDDARQEAADDLECAAEWQMASDALAHDENQALRMLARQRTDDRTHTAWLESQVYARGRKLHAAYARIVSLEREIDALREERDTLAAKLDAVTAERDSAQLEILTAQVDVYTEEAKTGEAHDTVCQLEAENAALREERDTLAAKLDAATARLAERENAALVADATDVCAGFSAAALYRMYTLEKGISEERRRAVERLTARLNGAQIAADIGLDDAHEDDDDAPPATLGDRRQQESRSIEWTPPTRSKPDAAA